MARWPLVVALTGAVLWGIALVREMRAVAGNHWTYPLDDTYIHLTLARTLVETGVWGLNPEEVATATSSPLWALLLAGALKLGAGAEIAGLYSATASLLLLVVADRILVAARMGAVGRLVTLASIVLLMPVPVLAVQGMEHPLHAALAAAFLLRWSTRVGTHAVDPILVGLALLASATRIETAFLLLVPVGERFLRGRRLEAAAIVVAAVLPWAAMGAFSVAHGGMWLPNSIVVKSAVLAGDFTQPALGRVWTNVVRNANRAPELVIGAVALVGLAPSAAGRPRAVATAASAQILLGGVGWGGRYEAWLVALLPLAFAEAITVARLRPALLVLVGFPLAVGADRCARLNAHAIEGARAVWQMNVTLGRFAAKLPHEIRIASTDAGAMTWFGRPYLIDLVGLGTTSIALRNVEFGLDGPAIGALVREHGAGVVVGWGRHLSLRFDEVEVPSDWMAAGRLEILARPEDAWPVFWVTDMAHWDVVRAALADLAGRMPEGTRMDVPTRVEIPIARIMPGDGAAVEADVLSFYAAAEATIDIPVAGTLEVWASGTTADGVGPWLWAEIPGRDRVERAVAPPGGLLDLGPVMAGDRVVLRFANDGVDATGADRNLSIGNIAVRLGP